MKEMSIYIKENMFILNNMHVKSFILYRNICGVHILW